MDKIVFAFCWAKGAIGFGQKVPDGAIGIARGPRATLRELIKGTSRLAYDGKTMLVPGVPEASNEKRALDALHRYMSWIAKRNRLGVKVLLRGGA